MDFRKVRYFVVAAEEQHFGRAAERLHVAESAVSRQMRSLEIDLGVSLFQRTGRGIRLSRAGRQFLGHATQLLATLEHARSDMKRFSLEEKQTVRLGVPEFYSSIEDVMNLIRSFEADSPQCAIIPRPMMTSLQLNGLADRTIDAGFMYAEPPDDDVLKVPIALHRFAIAMSKDHPLANRELIELDDLEGENFIGVQRKWSPIIDVVARRCRENGLNVKIVQEASSLSGLFSLVAAGVGIALAHRLVNPLPNVVFRDFVGFDLDAPLNLLWRRSNSDPTLERFVRHVSQGVTAGLAQSTQ